MDCWTKATVEQNILISEFCVTKWKMSETLECIMILD